MNALRISGFHYNLLQQHLYPGDNKEAVAIALCGRSDYQGNHTLLVQDLLLVPYGVCDRKSDFIRWPTEVINTFLERAAKHQLAIVKIHCHPGPDIHEYFSELDDESDRLLFRSIHSWLDDNLPHASCIMLPDGRLFGRFFNGQMGTETVHKIAVAGSDVLIWHYQDDRPGIVDEYQLRNLQAFGQRTVHVLNKMKVAVVGCSGTGSPVIEQLKRLGVGELILVDPDFVDGVNLNRIIGTTSADAAAKTMKVDVMRRGIEEVGMGTKVTTFAAHISRVDIIKAIADSDYLISCVDGTEGRHNLNLISSFYVLPLMDMGVKLNADGNGGIKNIFGAVHYIQPGGSSLLSRQQYSLESLLAESVKRMDQEEYARNQYLANVNESQPAVISINMQVAATAVNDFLARIHPYRNISNSDVDAIKIDFADGLSYTETFTEVCPFFRKWVGKGDVEPLLNSPELSDVKAVL
ncbi:ThiF family adenylyltransferase [Mucilaginibacter conchicola]|uniref:ThiF family adenylyltransferase n=1 Tax=Mucilaginibacter conchicola TaxID=2303333 RepID=A0A372NUP8_9SPHI|nr:ThiF family adenylyltransferase [Mucilaginibacter conchicola]RFZ92946.1 ThiF family adenylyltransferase [Mucilaginibacter conchicola]